MPHIVLRGAPSATVIHRELAPFEERAGSAILKLREGYLARAGNRLLLEAVVVDGSARRFIVEIDEHGGRVTVRLFCLTDPEKTEGVKQLLAAVARRVLRMAPGATVERTNLEKYLEEPRP